MSLEAIDRMSKILRSPVNVRQLAGNATFEKVVEAMYDQLATKAIELPYAFYPRPFEEEGTSLDAVLATTIDLSALPDEMTVAELLRALLAQLPGPPADIVVTENFIEVTTRKNLEARGHLEWRPFAWLTGRQNRWEMSLAEFEGSSSGLWLIAACAVIALTGMVLIWRRVHPRRVRGRQRQCVVA